MKEYRTASALAAHLSTLISDPNLVTMAVRKRFPTYDGPNPRRIGQEELKATSCSKPVAGDEGYMDSDIVDRTHRLRMQLGSQALLAGIRLNHPKIMEALGC